MHSSSSSHSALTKLFPCKLKLLNGPKVPYDSFERPSLLLLLLSALLLSLLIELLLESLIVVCTGVWGVMVVLESFIEYSPTPCSTFVLIPSLAPHNSRMVSATRLGVRPALQRSRVWRVRFIAHEAASEMISVPCSATPAPPVPTTTAPSFHALASCHKWWMQKELREEQLRTPCAIAIAPPK
jgi:hypothetical protein